MDSEKSELVKAPVGGAKKGVSQEKAMAAMKSHSEAEKRRRERINSHLNTLRGLVPGKEKVLFVSNLPILQQKKMLLIGVLVY